MNNTWSEMVTFIPLEHFSSLVHTIHMGYLNSHFLTNHMGVLKPYSFLIILQTLSYDYKQPNALPSTSVGRLGFGDFVEWEHDEIS